MDDTGIDRRAAETDQNESGKGQCLTERKQQNSDPHDDNAGAKPYHLRVVQFHGDKSADGPSDRDADKKHTGKICGAFGGYTFMEYQVTACPKTGGLLKRAVAEKHEHDLLCAGDGKNFF